MKKEAGGLSWTPPPRVGCGGALGGAERGTAGRGESDGATHLLHKIAQKRLQPQGKNIFVHTDILQNIFVHTEDRTQDLGVPNDYLRR
jgi:hypothetical protein